MSEKRNEPKLRFPEYSSSWDKKKLGEKSKIFSGGTPSSGKAEYYGGEIPFIRSGEIGARMTELTLSVKGLENSSAKMVDEGDLLLAIYGATSGEAAISQISGAINQAILCIRPELDRYFLLNWLKRNKEIILATYLQGGQGNLSGEIVKSFEVFSPSLPEQQKIAEFLTTVDRRIELLQAKKEKLEAYKKGVMQKIFAQKLRFKADDGSEFPDWEERKLGEVADINMGQSPDSKSYNDIHEGLPLIQGNADLKNRKVEPRQWTSSPTKTSLPGDIIMTVRAPVGYIGLNHLEACLGRGVCSITAKKSKALQPFLFQTLVFMEPNWKSIEQGSTFTAVSSSDVKTFLVNLPRLEEQKKIVQFLTSLDRSIENLNQQITHTQTWKKGLLQKMFV